MADFYCPNCDKEIAKEEEGDEVAQYEDMGPAEIQGRIDHLLTQRNAIDRELQEAWKAKRLVVPARPEGWTPTDRSLYGW